MNMAIAIAGSIIGDDDNEHNRSPNRNNHRHPNNNSAILISDRATVTADATYRRPYCHL